MFKKRKAEQKLTKVEKDIRDTELIIALILAFMTAIPFIFTYLDFLGLISPTSLAWKIILTILLFIAIILAPFATIRLRYNWCSNKLMYRACCLSQQ